MTAAAHLRPERRVAGPVFLWLAWALVAAPAGRAADARDDQPPKHADPSQADDESSATIAVKGMGWWRNRELRKTIQLLKPEAGFGPRLDAAFVEDGVVLLQSSLERDGFLRPSGSVRLTLQGKPVGEYFWSGRDVPVIPRDLNADHAVFMIDPGVRYTFDHLQFTGLTALDEDEARSYFVEEGFVFGGAAAREFSPAALSRGVKNLQEALVRLGYADAKTSVQDEERDNRTGDVDVTIAVDEGRFHRVASVQPPAHAPAIVADTLRKRAAGAAGARFSPVWRQQFMQDARRVLYEKGYAAAEVNLQERGPPHPDHGVLRHDLQLQVEPGPQVHVGAVKFVGDQRTHESVLRRATRVDAGDLFDRSAIDKDRVRLGALGTFTSIQTTIAKPQPSVWDVTYDLKPGKRLEVSLLFGYGSYERLRGGIEVVHTDLLGQAHRGRLQLIYSQKSESGDYLYTVPQIFGTTTDASARLFGLSREEVSFDRKEFGGSLGARKRIRWFDTDAALRYQFEKIRSDVFDPAGAGDAPTDSNVASLTLDLTRDKLDNPISPHHGLLLNLTLETAAQAIGGQVNYQRLDLQASWHHAVGREKYIHIGLRHGLVYALWGSPSQDIPLAKRYFPGGENTIRGFIEGRASPRDARGTFIGAEVSTILNLEYEQGLAQHFAAVAFVDAGLTAASLSDYPGNQTRVSLGLGLRYNTPIGPARLEYGYNVVRESGDGHDAWHLSLGYPF